MSCARHWGFVGLSRCYLGLYGVALEITWKVVSDGIEIEA